MGPVTIGVDIGQRVDPTAIAVAELERRGDDAHHVIRRMERLPSGTSYPDVARRLAEVVAGVRARFVQDEAEQQILPRWQRAPSVDLELTIYVDATGVGQPVVDILAVAVAGVPLHAVYFTHGDRRTVDGLQVTLGKAWLVSQLQALLQTGRILLPKMAEAEVLAKELMDYEIQVTEQANDTYGAFKVGTHDDLVTALGLAVQPAPGQWSWLDPELARALQDGTSSWQER